LGYIASMAAKSPTEVWAVGSRLNGQGVTVPLIERTNGSGWQIVKSHDPARNMPTVVSSIAGDMNGGAWVAGTAGNHNFSSFIQHCR